MKPHPDELLRTARAVLRCACVIALLDVIVSGGLYPQHVKITDPVFIGALCAIVLFVLCVYGQGMLGAALREEESA